MMLPVFLLLFCCHRFRQCLDYTGWCFQYFCFFSSVTVFVNAWIILVGASSIFASFLPSVFINAWIIVDDASSIFASFLMSPFSSMLGLYWLVLPVFFASFLPSVFINAWIIVDDASSIPDDKISATR